MSYTAIQAHSHSPFVDWLSYARSKSDVIYVALAPRCPEGIATALCSVVFDQDEVLDSVDTVLQKGSVDTFLFGYTVDRQTVTRYVPVAFIVSRRSNLFLFFKGGAVGISKLYI